MQVKIEKYDDLGRGIAYLNGKVLFVPKTVPGDIVEIAVINDKKNFSECQVLKYIEYSPERINSSCPYFDSCGGCDFLNVKYENSLNYKVNKVKEIFNKNGISINPKVVLSSQNLFYRNKITLKVQNGKLGYFKNNSHDLVEIDKCIIASNAINSMIPYIKKFNILNGNVTIRSNQNEEILLVIESYDNLNININEIKKNIKLVGIVINNRLFYGVDFLNENINDLNYRISYDSFFQINPRVAQILFNTIDENIDVNDNVLDIYCGVGTLSLSAAKKAKQVVGIEIVKNAILNAKFNAKINNIQNTEFILGDASNIKFSKYNNFNKVIVDPPRSGLTNSVISTILKINPEEIIYVSCDPQTLVRDIKILSANYVIKDSFVLDMFCYSYHVETIVILNKIF